MFHFINIFMDFTWKHGSGSGLQIFLEAEAEAKVHRFHITGVYLAFLPNFSFIFSKTILKSLIRAILEVHWSNFTHFRELLVRKLLSSQKYRGENFVKNQ